MDIHEITHNSMDYQKLLKYTGCYIKNNKLKPILKRAIGPHHCAKFLLRNFSDVGSTLQTLVILLLGYLAFEDKIKTQSSIKRYSLVKDLSRRFNF